MTVVEMRFMKIENDKNKFLNLAKILSAAKSTGNSPELQ